MPKKKPLGNNETLVADNSPENEKTIGVVRALIPINRNLSEKLFGQLYNLLERSSR